MKWILIIYFTTGAFANTDYAYYNSKSDCLEALHEIQKRPDTYKLAWCKPSATEKAQ